MIIKGYIFGVFYALLCLLLAFVLYKIGVAKKTTRKVVHILVGFEWVILYHFMGAGVHFLALCLLFLAVLFISHRKNLMPMISSDGDNAPGTVYYAVAMSIMATITLFVPKMITPFGIGVFCTSFGDGFAGIVGQCLPDKIDRINKRIYGKKTVFGTAANFVFCLLTVLIFNNHFSLNFSLIKCLLIALFATELELLVGRGLDNIAVTLGASFLSYFLINYGATTNYVLPIIITPLMIAFAVRKRALTKGGVVAAIIVDAIISACLGNAGFLVLLSFFILGIISDKIKKKHKKIEQIENGYDNSRSYKQVLANSAIASVLALAFLITSEQIFVLCFVAAFAEALADTFASGIGVFSKHTFNVIGLKPCKKGLSGGISLLGTVSSIVGSIIVAVVARLMGLITSFDILIVIFSGFLGCLVDSILGSTLQVKFKCQICNEIVEQKEHCNHKTVKQSGISFVDNNVVNLFGTVSAAIFAMILYIM